MRLRDHAQEVLERLRPEYAGFETALDYQEPWQLIVAVALSAQTTDENVNRVTKDLFAKYTSPQDIAEAEVSELEKDIYSTGYYKSKARNIKKLCADLVERFDSQVPDEMQELITLSGVGRKTANVVLHILHKKSQGIVMDTHIARVTHRLGFTDKKSPSIGEKTMMQILPPEDWKDWGDTLIQHGREICHARKPKCEQCILNDICPSAFTFQ